MSLICMFLARVGRTMCHSWHATGTYLPHGTGRRRAAAVRLQDFAFIRYLLFHGLPLDTLVMVVARFSASPDRQDLLFRQDQSKLLESSAELVVCELAIRVPIEFAKD